MDLYDHPFMYPNEPVKFSQIDVDALLIHCVNTGASDITIQTQENVFCEIQGKMIRVTKRRLAKPEVMEIMNKIYGNDSAIGLLNGGEDVDTGYEIKPDRDTRVRFRCNFTANNALGHTGYQLTLRPIKSIPPHISTMNLPQELLDAIAPKQGMVLVTGSTGSGKSTLLSSIIRMLCEDVDGNRKILTYESPIEYVYDEVEKPSTSVSQVEIPKHSGSFQLGIRNSLRRKPSIILVGEMRDKETISEGITASMTGHLLYSTLHSNNVSDTIRRMVNVFNEDKQSKAMDIISSVRVILSQMLIPSVDGTRVPLREYLVFNDGIVDMLLEEDANALTFAVKKAVKSHGRTFEMDVTEKYDAGIISKYWYDYIMKSVGR